MFEKTPLTVKIVVIINTIINFFFLIILCFRLLKHMSPEGFGPFVLGVLIIAINTILGFMIISLKNLARVCFMGMQIIYLIFSTLSFLYILLRGLTEASLGERQLKPFLIAIVIPTLLMVFFLFCLFYLRHPKVKEYFRQ